MMSAPLSLWKRQDNFDDSLPIRARLHKAITDLFAKYDSVTEDNNMEFENQDASQINDIDHDAKHDSIHQGKDEDDTDRLTVSMSSQETVYKSPQQAEQHVIFDTNESEETLSICESKSEICDIQFESPKPTKKSHTLYYHKRKNLPICGNSNCSEFSRCGKVPEVKLRPDYNNSCQNIRCLRCEAYDAHCKSAADGYRRTLTNYTKTVSELMLGFRKVLERYPELKADSTDEHLRNMVQAALGRSNLVQEMVRLAAKREAVRPTNTDSFSESSITCQCKTVAISVLEALKTCYSDSEALRMILQRYTNLYVRYLEVWRDMCAKISKNNITVLEFVNLTQERPGIVQDEPWSEAKAYIARMLNRLECITPRDIGEACTQSLREIHLKLSYAPKDFFKFNQAVDAAVEDIRTRLDDGSRKCCWDAHMVDLYCEIRSDLTVLEALVGVGEISVKSLLQDRCILVSQIRKMTMNQGALELQIAQKCTQMKESTTSNRNLEVNLL